MTLVLGTVDTTLEAIKGEAFEFTFPDILDTTSNQDPVSVDSRTGRWEITLSGFAAGMALHRTDDDRSESGFLSVTTGMLSDISLRWTPTAGQSFFVLDGRQFRPRLWTVGIQIEGAGDDWVDTEFELGLSISVTDRKRFAKELVDDISEGLYGPRREVGLGWYKHDNLDIALGLKYNRPPLLATLTVPLVQPTEDLLSQVVGIEPGDYYQVGINAEDAADVMAGVVMATELQIGRRGRGVSYKRLTVLERLQGDGAVNLSLNSVQLAFNGFTLRVGEA